VETIVKLVNINGVIVIEVSHNSLELDPICSRRMVSLLDALEFSPCYLFRVCFSKGLGNCSFEIFPRFVGALSFRDQRFDPCPGVSSILGARIVDLFCIYVKFVRFTIKFELTLSEECAELGSFAVV
jgi:hypothetical protein